LSDCHFIVISDANIKTINLTYSVNFVLLHKFGRKNNLNDTSFVQVASEAEKKPDGIGSLGFL
jgi:hypothetical protein